MSFPFFPFQFFILFLEPLVEGPDLIPALRACRCSTHAEFRSCSAGLAVSPTLFRFGNQCQFVGNARKRRLWIASLRTGEIQNAGAFKAARAQYIERIARPGVSVCEPLVTAGTWVWVLTEFRSLVCVRRRFWRHYLSLPESQSLSLWLKNGHFSCVTFFSRFECFAFLMLPFSGRWLGQESYCECSNDTKKRKCEWWWLENRD